MHIRNFAQKKRVINDMSNNSNSKNNKNNPLTDPSIRDANESSNFEHAPISFVKSLPHSNECDQLAMLCNMINFITEGIFIINNDGVIEMVNAYAAKLFGAQKEALIGRKWSDFLNDLHRDEYDELLKNLKASKEANLSHGPKEILLNCGDGTSLAADLSLSCLPYLQTKVNPLFIGVLHNLTSHKAEYNKLRRQARTDKLTGLANRHAFEESLHDSWLECVTNNQPISMLMIDIDYFKQFNDQHGHINGDKCIKKVGAAINSCVPSRDCLTARYGGEEFTMILPRCNASVAEAIAKQVQKQIAALSFVDQGLSPEVKITVSQGIACEKSSLYSKPETLLCLADEALYKAKSSGRDRIKVNNKDKS
jgi:diguanylate cyclase (GGDEF)-like protein/PAS domain S-box-containing protein